MVGSYRTAGRPMYPDYQQVVQAYRALRQQYDQLAVHEQQQAQRIAQLERALTQATQGRPAAPATAGDAGQMQALARRIAELERELAREQQAAERAEQQAARLEQEGRDALERNREAEQKLAVAQEQIDRLRAQLDEAGDATEWRDRFLRQQADADNFRRRQERRFAQQAAEERRSMLRDMLPLADNLDLGLQHVAQDAAGDDPRLQGYAANLRAVRQAFLDTLERYGVRSIAALGEPFDPNQHEALGHLASDSVPEGHVAHVAQAGFADGDGLVRPARVLISTGPTDSQTAVSR